MTGFITRHCTRWVEQSRECFRPLIVGTVLQQLERRGEIPHVSTQSDTRGRPQPVRRFRKPIGEIPQSIWVHMITGRTKQEPHSTAEFPQLNVGADTMLRIADLGGTVFFPRDAFELLCNAGEAA